MENIQRLLGGGGGDGGGGEEEEESVLNVEEEGGELLAQSTPEMINNFPPEEPNSCQENGKRKTDSIGSRSRNMSDKTVTAVLKADKTKKTNSSYKEGNCEEYSSGKNVKEKSPKVREEKKKAERTDHVFFSEYGDIGTKSDIKEMRKVQKDIESMMALF